MNDLFVNGGITTCGKPWYPIDIGIAASWIIFLGIIEIHRQNARLGPFAKSLAPRLSAHDGSHFIKIFADFAMIILFPKVRDASSQLI